MNKTKISRFDAIMLAITIPLGTAILFGLIYMVSVIAAIFN